MVSQLMAYYFLLLLLWHILQMKHYVATPNSLFRVDSTELQATKLNIHVLRATRWRVGIPRGHVRPMAYGRECLHVAPVSQLEVLVHRLSYEKKSYIVCIKGGLDLQFLKLFLM